MFLRNTVFRKFKKDVMKKLHCACDQNQKLDDLNQKVDDLTEKVNLCCNNNSGGGDNNGGGSNDNPGGGGNLPETSIIDSATFEDIIGVVYLLENEDENGSDPSNLLQKLSVFNNMRTYNMIGHSTSKNGVQQDFGPTHTFADNIPSACNPDCNINCWNENEGANLAAWKKRWCQWDGLFNLTTFSPIYFVKDFRSYPDRFFSSRELGDAYQAGYKYAKVLASTLYPKVNCFEIGNEPHGYPGILAWQNWSKGFVRGIREVAPRALISTADIQNSGTETFNNVPINTKLSDVPQEVIDAVDILKVHQYNFKEDNTKWPPISCANPPEIQTMSEYESVEVQLSTMAPYRNTHKLMLGEFGFDWGVLGQTTQAAYLLRTIVLAMYYGFDYAMIYAAQDDPSAGNPFDKIGLIDKDGNELESFILMKKLVQDFGKLKVVSRVDNPNFEYSFKLKDSSTNEFYKIEWNIVDKTVPQIIKL